MSMKILTGRKIDQMSIKHTSIAKPSKMYLNCNFWSKNIPSGNPAFGTKKNSRWDQRRKSCLCEKRNKKLCMEFTTSGPFDNSKELILFPLKLNDYTELKKVRDCIVRQGLTKVSIYVHTYMIDRLNFGFGQSTLAVLLTWVKVD
jgi:hypothetical protein